MSDERRDRARIQVYTTDAPMGQKSAPRTGLRKPI